MPRPREGVERDADVPGALPGPQAGVQAKPPFKPVIAGARGQPPTPRQAPRAPQEGSLRDLFLSQMRRCVNAKEADPHRAQGVLMGKLTVIGNNDGKKVPLEEGLLEYFVLCLITKFSLTKKREEEK